MYINKIEKAICNKWLKIRAEVRLIVQIAFSAAFTLTIFPIFANLVFSAKVAMILIVFMLTLTTLVVIERIAIERQLLAKANEQLAQKTKELEQLNEKLKLESKFDSLTGLLSRSYLDRELPRLQAEALRHDCFLWTIMLDLDNLKAINDNFGHESGDELLRYFSCKLQRLTRSTDNCGRYGGDEFLIVGIDVDPNAGNELIKRILKDMSSWILDIKGVSIKVTASIGYASSKIKESNTFTSIIKEADLLMYENKKGGKKSRDA